MALETFPAGLFPQPRVSFNGRLKPSVVRTQMDSGRFRQRSRFTSELMSLNVSWEMSDFQFGMFKSWVNNKVTRGADWFYIVLPIGGETLPVLCHIVNGGYTHKYRGVLYWDVTVTLETEDPLTWSEDIYETLLAAGSIEDLEAAANALNIEVNQHLPSLS